LMLRLKRALVVGGATILAFILVLPTTAQGVRTNVPDMGTRLSKTPLLGPKLFAGPSLAKVDLAYLVGLCVFGLTLYFGSKAAGLLLASDASHEVNHEPAHLVIVGGASLSLLADAALLYLGLCDRMWGKTSFSFIALLFTTVYVLGIVAVSLILTNIRTELSQLEDR
ncbi:MAG TPA: hypothetical protein VD866_17255, partial [Urbifossiella sp.]|nr:hypothetical protein [Urbifossiella sp.]